MRGPSGCAVIGVAVASLLLTGCGANESPEQSGVTNGGLDAGAEGVADRIAVMETNAQHIDLDAAIALLHVKKSKDSDPRTGTCPVGPLTLVVMEGRFPKQAPDVRAEEIYASPYAARGRLGICSRAFVTTLPALPDNLGTINVPGTRSAGA